MSKKPPTVYEVAKLADVSAMAVSIALRPDQGGKRVSAATRQRILEAAKKLNYRPNPSAKTLTLARTNQIGFCLGTVLSLNLSLSPWHQVLTTMQSQLWKWGYRLSIHYFEHGKDEGFSEFLIPNRFVDGIIVQGRNVRPEEVKQILAAGMPAVSLYENIDGFHSLTVDTAKMGADAASYLYAMGHRDIAILALKTEKEEWNGRISGFLNKAAELAMPVPERRQFLAEPRVNELPSYEAIASSLYGAFRRKRAKVTALYVPSDHLAFPLVQMLESDGIMVGRDISLISYDNMEGEGIMPWKTPRLTTFRPPFPEIGAEVARFFGEESHDTPPGRLAFHAQLIERTSVIRR